MGKNTIYCKFCYYPITMHGIGWAAKVPFGGAGIVGVYTCRDLSLNVQNHTPED